MRFKTANCHLKQVLVGNFFLHCLFASINKQQYFTTITILASASFQCVHYIHLPSCTKIQTKLFG